MNTKKALKFIIWDLLSDFNYEELHELLGWLYECEPNMTQNEFFCKEFELGEMMAAMMTLNDIDVIQIVEAELTEAFKDSLLDWEEARECARTYAGV